MVPMCTALNILHARGGVRGAPAADVLCIPVPPRRHSAAFWAKLGADGVAKSIQNHVKKSTRKPKPKTYGKT